MTARQTLFIDLGGVLLTNGWDRVSRRNAMQHFGIDQEEFDLRHHEFYDLHETDQISLDQYLDMTLFYEKRPFTREEFKQFMFEQSQPYPEMIALIKQLKLEYHLNVAAVSNEGRELAEYRIRTFALSEFIDHFFVSCFVHVQKPNLRIFQMALDVTHSTPAGVLYLDDRPNLVEAAAELGILGLPHRSAHDTETWLRQHLTA
jgi:putative hydrolase of the HAD superfamily